MKLKTLLLGSAAAFAVAGGAQAADLSVAEPVDYVRVCDAFGTGYWYIPGTDTCLKIGGYVQFQVQFHSATDVDKGTGTHSASWEFDTEAGVNVTAKSMTEYGPLTGFLELRGKSNNNDGTNAWNGAATSGNKARLAYLDSAWLELGMLLVGRTGSIYDYGGGFTFDGSSYDSDASADQVRLSWAMSGFGVQLGIEDPRDRWGTSLSTSYSLPNIVGNITVNQGHWDGKLSVGFAETVSGSGFGLQAAATFKLDQIAPGDQLRLKAAWAQGQVGSFAGGGVYANGSSVWSALASFQHFWMPTLSSAVTFSYLDYPAGLAGNDVWSVYGNLVWAPVTGFLAGVEAGYTTTSAGTAAATNMWTAKIRLKRSW
jgi:hypothetical protein